MSAGELKENESSSRMSAQSKLGTASSCVHKMDKEVKPKRIILTSTKLLWQTFVLSQQNTVGGMVM